MATRTHLASIPMPNESLIAGIRDDLRRAILPTLFPLLGEGYTWDTVPLDPSDLRALISDATGGMTTEEVRAVAAKFHAVFSCVDGLYRIATPTPMLEGGWTSYTSPPGRRSGESMLEQRATRRNAPYRAVAAGAANRAQVVADARRDAQHSMLQTRMHPSPRQVMAFVDDLFVLIDALAVGHSYPTIAVTLTEGLSGRSVPGRRALRETLREFEETYAADFDSELHGTLRDHMFMGPRGGLAVIEDILAYSSESRRVYWPGRYWGSPIYRNRMDQVWWSATTTQSSDAIESALTELGLEVPNLPDAYPAMRPWPPGPLVPHKRVGPWITTRSVRGMYHPRTIYNYTIVQ